MAGIKASEKGHNTPKNKTEQRVLSVEQLKQYFRSARKPLYRNYVIVKCYTYFGLRNNELRNLMIEDIDIPNKTIFIRNAKGGKSRYVPIIDLRIDSEGILDTLHKWIGKRTTGYFLGKNKGITDRQIRNIVKGIARNADIDNYEEIHPHTLRHSFTTLAINEYGSSAYSVSKVLGHSDVKTTQKNYDHSTNDFRQGIERFNRKKGFKKLFDEEKDKVEDTPMNRLLLKFMEAMIS